MEQKETHWTRIANDFEERNTYVVGKASKQITLDELAKQTNLGNTLEVACGNGTYSKVLVKNATSLICTDFSDEMVAVSKLQLKAFSNIKVEKANCFELPYDDETFDTVFMANLLHVIPTPEKAVNEAKRVVKQGGQIIALDFTKTGMSFFAKIGMMQRYLKSYGKPPKTGSNVDDKRMCQLFTSNGLDVKFTKLIGGASKAAFGKATKPQVKIIGKENS